MKINHLTVQNYKRFLQSKTFSFIDSDGFVNEKTLIVGNNGTGKTSILQAIVILLAYAVREKFNPKKLDWPGFEYRHLQTGRLPLKIEAEIVFDDDEIQATQEYANRLKEIGVKRLGSPASSKNVKLFFDYQENKPVARASKEVFYQLHGYQYAKRLASLTPQKNLLFEKVGNIYWYTEQRNSHNITNLLDNKPSRLDDIRNFLASAYNYHSMVQQKKRTIKEGEFDFYGNLEKLYKVVFPNRSFVGPSPRFDIYEEAKAPDFFLYDGYSQYEISGMSAGERAAFPILMDFTRWNINNSIIIIDELELHLHPPLQQMLVRALLKIGQNNQFIFTSHSSAVSSMFNDSENQIIWLPNE
ncbi:MAG: ATPase [Deltaproteobacteria bacterium]|nr:MAG: ATPase [Deltaproteobacteria bacterium]